MKTLEKMGVFVVLVIGILMLLGVVSLGFFVSIASGEIAGAAILGSILEG